MFADSELPPGEGEDEGAVAAEDLEDTQNEEENGLLCYFDLLIFPFLHILGNFFKSQYVAKAFCELALFGGVIFGNALACWLIL